MSWTQGVQLREDLPEKFILWAENYCKPGFKLEYIVWDDTEPGFYECCYYSIIELKHQILKFEIINKEVVKH